MSLSLEGKNCPFCHAYLFDEDDVVYCPVCGAPHHRDCYNKLGHCALEVYHGTDKQYDKLEKSVETKRPQQDKQNSTEYIKCGMCGEKYDSSLKNCPECGTPNLSKLGGNYVVFDFLGGVPADADLGDGVTADEAKRFVAANTHRYIPKFAAMASGVKSSWNWLAFFFPSAWLLGRKMYKSGILIGILSVAFSLLTAPFIKAINSLGASNSMTNAQFINEINRNLPNIGVGILILAFVGALLNLILKIIVGIKADYIYKKHTISTIKEIKSNSDDIDYDFHKRGGISFIATLIGLFAVQYLPSLIAYFAGI